MNDFFTWYETYKATCHGIDDPPYTAVAERGTFRGRLRSTGSTGTIWWMTGAGNRGSSASIAWMGSFD